MNQKRSSCSYASLRMPVRFTCATLIVAVFFLIIHKQTRSVANAADLQRVLFIMADDLNTSLGCYGHSIVKTPNIDRLAARGVRFERAYCQFPLCGPSRNSLLTGLYPNSTGIFENEQIFRQSIPWHTSLPQAFRMAGGTSIRIGKLYHYNVPASIGTSGHDDPASWTQTWNPAGCDRLIEQPEIFSLVPGSFGGDLSWHASQYASPLHTDGLLARDAKECIERLSMMNHGPAFVGIGFFRPHTPFVAPKEFFDRISLDSLTLIENVDKDIKDIPQVALRGDKKSHATLTEALQRQAIGAYYASIMFMDEQVGVVLDAIQTQGLADSTIIVFTSDHGYQLGEHGLWQKMSLFETATRVPLIIAAPGAARPGAVVDEPVGLIDLFPTLMELCGLKVSPTLQGQSLVPMLSSCDARGRGWTMSQIQFPGGNVAKKETAQKHPITGYSLRTQRWRYTEWKNGDELELYDHESDPNELVNLAHRSADNYSVEVSTIIKNLSRQLNSAVSKSNPGGDPMARPPKINEKTWSPMLVNP